MKLIRILLFPIVPVYYIVTWLRNFLYDKGVLCSKSYDFPIICVGNLSTGGTGKTPMIEYIKSMLMICNSLINVFRNGRLWRCLYITFTFFILRETTELLRQLSTNFTRKKFRCRCSAFDIEISPEFLTLYFA